MTRDEMEAVCWQRLSAFRTERETFPATVDAILQAADAFAATTAATALEVNGTRHRLPTVHYRNPRWLGPSCRYGRGSTEPTLTTDLGQVTCRGCKKSAAYKNALELAEAS